MNIGITSNQPQSYFSSQATVEPLSTEKPAENNGSVLKPLTSAGESSNANSTTEKQKPAASDQSLSSENAQEQEKDKQQQRLEAQQQRIEQQQISELAARDREVRNHERAHAAVGGQYAGAPRYQFERGPDGINYAVGGEVSISTGGVSGDPQATIEKAQIIRRAALAPSEPSSQDRKVAAEATQMEAEARVELANLQREERLAEQERSEQREEAEPDVERAESRPIINSERSQPANASSDEKGDSSNDIEPPRDLTQQFIDLTRRITSTNANGLYQEPGQLFDQVV